jgi:hypothetical protein
MQGNQVCYLHGDLMSESSKVVVRGFKVEYCLIVGNLLPQDARKDDIKSIELQETVSKMFRRLAMIPRCQTFT